MAAQFQYLDLTRVAINGWSYGGYLALRGIMDFPHVFKVKSFSELCSTLLFPFLRHFFLFFWPYVQTNKWPKATLRVLFGICL